MDFSRASWRKSRQSTQNGSCVEIAAVTVTGGKQAPGHVVAVRDSKDPRGPVLALTAAQWRLFTDHVKAGAFDLT